MDLLALTIWEIKFAEHFKHIVISLLNSLQTFYLSVIYIHI